MRPRRLVLPLILLAASPVARQAAAQTLEDRLRSQLIAVTAQLRDAQAAQATAASEVAAAQKERDGLKARLARSEAQLAAARRAPRAPVADPAAARDAAERARAAAEDQAKLASVQADAARTGQELDQTRAERDRAASALAAGQAGLAACRAKNAEAIGVARDVLAAYHRVGLGQVLARREPLTGLARVRFEQLEQDYGDRLYDSRLDARPRAPVPDVRPPPAAKPPR